LKNKVFNTIEELEDTLCGIVKLFSPKKLNLLLILTSRRLYQDDS